LGNVAVGLEMRKADQGTLARLKLQEAIIGANASKTVINVGIVAVLMAALTGR
jgi:hypothetical protein